MTVARTGTRTLLLCGYYGESNLGDDALLQVLLQQIPAGFGLLITANDREALRALAPMAVTVSRKSLVSVLGAVGRTDALILGGGSLLQDSTSLRSLIYYLLLIVMGSAFLLMTSRWFLAVTGVAVASWALVSYKFVPDMAWTHYGFAWLLTLALAGFVDGLPHEPVHLTMINDLSYCH